MDALALLCNLHGDGPQTLERLHRAGCRSLANLATLPPAELARRLGRGVEAARRFQREGRALGERLGTELFEGEPPRAEAAHAAGHSAHAARAAPAATAPEALAVRTGAPAHVTRRELFESRPAIDAVLEAWRARDVADPPEPVRATRPAGPVASVSDGAAALAVGAIDGLSAERLAALLQAGIGDLSALARAEPLALARESGLSFTLVSRLSFLARRALAAAPPAPLAGASPPISARLAGALEPTPPTGPPATPPPEASPPGSVGGPFA